jgi:hypothetical protein
MFIEYKWINNVLHFRHDPDGIFTKCNTYQLNEILRDKENNLKELRSQNTELLEALEMIKRGKQ